MRARRPAALLASALLAVMCLSASAAERTSAGKPALPPGRDPGGFAIAVLSAGIDYRDPGIARWLARDGEGEIIGWDAVDNDNRPFAPAAQSPTPADGTASGADIARAIGGPGRRIVPVRIAENDPASVARALLFVSRTPAAVVVMASATRVDWTTLVGPIAFAAARGLLLVVPAGPQAAANGWPILRQAPNVILAAAAPVGNPTDPDVVYVLEANPGAGVALALAACWERLPASPDAGARKAAFLALVAGREAGPSAANCVPDAIRRAPNAPNPASKPASK